jgi:hypothetical protein
MAFTPINGLRFKKYTPAATASPGPATPAVKSKTSSPGPAAKSKPPSPSNSGSGAETTETRTRDSGGPSPKTGPITIRYSYIIEKCQDAASRSTLAELKKLSVRIVPSIPYTVKRAGTDALIDESSQNGNSS